MAGTIQRCALARRPHPVGVPTSGVGFMDRWQCDSIHFFGITLAEKPGKTISSRYGTPLAARLARMIRQKPAQWPIQSKGSTMKSQQSGFTLVEIAIVLVIIGLLLGGILKGQELINSAKVKNLANDFRVIPTYIYAYQDKFKALPGDDPAADTHLPTGALTDRGNGNGVIDGAWNSTTATDESF